MAYDRHLALGLPIGSRAIEGACKNLIHDRMERSGMRWFPDGAEATLNLRSVHLSDPWDDFWIFRTEREKQLLYSGQSIIPNQLANQDDVANAA